MIELYKTLNENVYEKLKSLLHTNGEIKRTENGKPYVDGFEFSITHTGDTALIAVCDKPVGIDAEKLKTRKNKSIFSRLTAREQDEICEDNAKFYKNWVVKEAYIKMHGGTLAHDLKRLEYFGGKLLVDGKHADCNILCSTCSDIIYAVCTDGEIPESLTIQTV